jgi:hypothetical protein
MARKLSKSDQAFIMNTAMLQYAVNHNLNTDDLYVYFNEVKNEWRIVRRADKVIVGRKTF